MSQREGETRSKFEGKSSKFAANYKFQHLTLSSAFENWMKFLPCLALLLLLLLATHGACVHLHTRLTSIREAA